MTTVNDSEREAIEQLLPWHAAGTLSRSDAQRVEAALASDPELARRYELVREELGQAIHLNESLGAPSARVMEKLFAKIGAEPVRKPAMSAGLAARIGEFFAELAPRTLAWSAALAAIVILLQTGFIASVVLKDNDDSPYRTASAPGAVKSQGAYALIRFQPQASADDVVKFLQANKLTVVDGPMPGGLYKIRIAPQALPKDILAATITRLQEDKVVGFVGAAD